MAKITTEELRVSNTRNFYDSLESDNYYLMGSATTPDTVVSNTGFSKKEFLRRAIFGTKIGKNDVRFLFERNDWQQNTVYEKFDDTVEQSKNSMVTVLQGVMDQSPFQVFKCIDNNKGLPSTIKPVYFDLTDDTEIVTADGYVWKYMFTIPTSEYFSFSTNTYLPYVEDLSVVAAAKSGISSIVVENTTPEFFKQFVLGSAIIESIQLIDTNVYKLGIGTSSAPVSLTNAYANSYLRLVNEGKVFKITASQALSSPANRTLDVFVETTENLIASININTDCELVPIIEIKGSTDEAVAYGILDDFGTLESVQFVYKGSGYTFASAKLIHPTLYDGQNSSTILRSIVEPYSGHGSDPVLELGMSKVIISSTLFSGENTSIPSTNTYTQVGIIKNPSFVTGPPPTTFDSRDILHASGDLTSSIETGNYISDTNGNYGFIHEIVYDSETDTTSVYLVDTSGTSTEFFTTSDTVFVRLTPTSPVIQNFVINTITRGVFNKKTGDVLILIDFDPITRTPTSREKIKITLDF